MEKKAGERKNQNNLGPMTCEISSDNALNALIKVSQNHWKAICFSCYKLPSNDNECFLLGGICTIKPKP